MSFFRNIGAMAVSSLFGQTALIVSGIISARALGPEDRGHLALVVLAPIIVGQITQMGIPVAVNYFVAADRGLAVESRHQIKRVALVQMLSAMLFMGLALFVTRSRIPPDLMLPAAVMTLALPGLILQEYGYGILQGLNRFSQVAVARLVPAASYSLLALLLWLVDQVTVLSLAIAWALSYGLSALVALMLLTGAGIPGAESGVSRTGREFRAFGLRTFVGSVSPMETFRLDQIIGAALLGPTALGLYVVAQSFSTLPKIIAINSGFVIYADAAGLAGKGRERIVSLLAKIVKLSCVNAALCILLAALLPWLNPLFFGQEFVSATAASQWLVLAAWIGATRKFLGELAKGLGYPLVQTWCELLIFPMLLGFAWLVVRAESPQNLALAVVTAQACVLAVCIAFVARAIQKNEPVGAGRVPEAQRVADDY